MERLAMETADITQSNIENILALFPNVATETEDENGKLKRAIDFDKLRQELSHDIVEGEECYDFTWVGKKEAMIEANRPIRKTLRPQRDKSINWDRTKNIYIEGDNLDALKLLQESYLGKVKMIYIDPPYNTGNDFVYRDNFTMDKESYDEKLCLNDDEGNKLFKNNESNGRFHSDWCSMIYPRLKLARNLLADDGVIFISMDENEIENLSKISNEVFGNKNHLQTFIWRKSKGSGNDSKYFMTEHEYVLLYAKNIENVNIINEIINTSEGNYTETDEYYETRGKYVLEKLDRGSKGYVVSLDYGIETPDGSYIFPNGRKEAYNDGWRWMWSKEKLQRGIEQGFVVVKKGKDGWCVYTKRYEKVDSDNNPIVRTRLYKSHIGFDETILNIQANFEIKKLFEKNYFSYPKPVNLIQMLTKMITKEDDIVLDFFSGSGTTAHAVMQLNAEDGGNRKFIMVQLPELLDEKSEGYKAGYKNICDIGEERIRRAGKNIQEELQQRHCEEQSDEAVQKNSLDCHADKSARNDKKPLDTGFRVFKIDDTNMKDVYYSPNEFKQGQLGMFESNIKEDRTAEDLLYEVLLNSGVELSLPHRVETIEGKEVHIIQSEYSSTPDLIACFEDNLPESVVRKIAEQQPTKVVFRDSSFVSDSNRINVEEIFKLKTPDTRVKVL